MNKKIFFLVMLQICFFATPILAQTDVCAGTNTSCLSPGTQHVTNSSNNWYTSHGTLAYGSNYPGSTSGTNSLLLWSYLGIGNGVFTCYDFQVGKTYRVCFWVRNNSGWPSNPFGRLYVKAANGLLDKTGYTSTTLATATSQQLIDQSYYGPSMSSIHPSTGASDWEFISVTFTPLTSFTSIWFYALNPQGPPPPGPAQWNTEYIVEVDDIRVTEMEDPAYNITTTSTDDDIDGCNGESTITISGMPSNAVANWSPTPFSVNSSGSVAVARPCSTTTYKIEITDPTVSSSTACATCIREVIYHTITVTPWADPSLLVYPTTPVPCLGTLNLDYNDPGDCAYIGSYTWVDPGGNSYSGKTQSISGVNSSMNGEWTLKISNTFKGCDEELKFSITVGSCCVSSPAFSFAGTNPITFNNMSTGIMNHTGTIWSFGDGTTSDAYSPTHNYNISTNENMNVCLTMLYTDDMGNTCCNRLCSLISVNANPCVVVADFTYTPTGMAPNEFTFTSTSTGSGTLCQFDWEFFDGPSPTATLVSNVSASPVKFRFYKPGPWYVCLTVTNCWIDPNGVVQSCSTKKCMWVNVSSIAPENTGLNSNNKTTDGPALTIYENPNHGDFSLILKNKEGTYNVIVRDPSGKEVYNNKHVFGKDPVKISLDAAAPGIYTVEVSKGSEKFVQQMSVIR